MEKERTTHNSAAQVQGKAPRRAKLIWIVLGMLALVVAYGVYVQFFVKQDQGLSDIFRILKEHGYAANVGLSGIYRPGNVIQTMESGPGEQERQIVSPLLFLWGSDCFPDLKPRDSQFVLPESAGTSSASLSLDASMLAKLVPMLKVESAAVADYSLKLDNTRVQTLARADVSGKFSDKCVQALRQALDDGDKIGWFSVIVEAVVADSLAFEMHWKTDSSVEARAALKQELQETLAVVAGKGGQSGGVDVDLTADDEKRTVIAAKGLVVVGYRARPLQPRFQ